ncbi:MAG TPA: polysaccharide deacetylase family protein [Terriglobales bacterium]
MPKRYITVSVDDGALEDPRAADLLRKHGLKATFYIPAKNPERAVMAPATIREIAKDFEIGGHTVNHISLHSLSDRQAQAEISEGKKWLDDLLGQASVSFCYPQGKFNRKTPSLVQAAGFLGARTCLFNLHSVPANPFLWGLTTHACDHSAAIQARHALIEGNLRGLRNFFFIYNLATGWRDHFARGMEHVDRHGGIVHLYFHSWEIDQLGQWGALDAALASAARRGFASVTNGDLFRQWAELKGELTGY